MTPEERRNYEEERRRALERSEEPSVPPVMALVLFLGLGLCIFASLLILGLFI